MLVRPAHSSVYFQENVQQSTPRDAHTHDLAEAMRLYLREKGTSQEQLAKELGISQSTISKTIRNRSHTYRDQIACILGFPSWEILVAHVLERLRETLID